MRLFIALELSPEAHQTLSQIQEQLKPKISGAKWVNPDNIHLTLKFLGETPEEKLPEIKAVMDKAALNTKPFTITLNKLGFFPNAQHPRIIWVGITKGVPLVSDTLEAPSKPHLTLARFKKPTKLPAAPDVQIPAISTKIDHITLFRSVLKPTGAEYTALYRAKF